MSSFRKSPVALAGLLALAVTLDALLAPAVSAQKERAPRKFYTTPEKTMKLTLILLLIACSVLAGCGASKPTPEQTISALDRFIKQDNPGATISVSDVEEATPDYFTVHFLFTDFAFKDERGAGHKLSSGKGSAGFSRSAQGKWVLDLVTIKEPGPFKNFEPHIEVN